MCAVGTTLANALVAKLQRLWTLASVYSAINNAKDLLILIIYNWSISKTNLTTEIQNSTVVSTQAEYRV